MNYTLAVFDMDGTILDTLEDLAASLNFALKGEGFPTRTLDEVRNFVGNGVRKLVERGVPGTASAAEIDEVYAAFIVHYKEHCADSTRPYDGILSLLKQLKKAGCKTAVVSNKADFAVKELCVRYFDGLFDAAVGERPGVKKKPAPDSVNEVLRLLSKDKADTVYIGDSEVDIETADNAGLSCISIDWGFRDRGFLIAHGAKFIVSAPEELARMVKGPEELKTKTGKYKV